MTLCARGCCWNPYGCARAYSCACHWDERKPGSRSNGTVNYSDPTANEAVRNVMKEGRRK